MRPAWNVHANDVKNNAVPCKMRADFFPRCRLVWVFVLVGVLLGTDVLSGLANKAHGAPGAAAQSPQAVPEVPEQDTLQPGKSEDEDVVILEESRKEVREATEWAARRVDSWFGNIPFEEGGKISKGRIRLRTIWREHDEVDVNLRFRVRMTLPNLQDKSHVFIGSENERDLVRGRPDTVTEQQRLLRENKSRTATSIPGRSMRAMNWNLLKQVSGRLTTVLEPPRRWITSTPFPLF